MLYNQNLDIVKKKKDMAKINPSTNIPTKVSSASAWILWHKALQGRYGKKTANTLFVEAWVKRGTGSANTSELRKYLEKKGVKIEGNLFNYWADTADDIGDWFGGVLGFSKWLTIALVVILVIAIAMILFNIARKPIETLHAVADVQSGGLASKGMGEGG